MEMSSTLDLFLVNHCIDLAKISYNATILSREYICCPYITMYYVMVVQIFHTFQDISCEF